MYRCPSAGLRARVCVQILKVFEKLMQNIFQDNTHSVFVRASTIEFVCVCARVRVVYVRVCLCVSVCMCFRCRVV